MAGLDLITRLQNSTTTLTLSLSSWHGVAATRNGNEIFIHPGIPGKGNIFTDDISCPVKRPSPTRVLAHELGHAAGASDNGPGRLNNINIWENSVMFPIEGYRRTVYEGF